MINLKHVDNGKGFDFGKTSKDYAKYRDIYPESFYQTLIKFGIGLSGQNILDLGTGTGVIPRYMHKYGAKFTGTDISADQLEQAMSLSKCMDINYMVASADNTGFADNTFDAVTACQCFWYFDITTTIPEIFRILKPGGCFAIMYMNGVPGKSAIMAKSEELAVKYNPEWHGHGYEPWSLSIPDWLSDMFYVETLHTYFEDIPFTRESWCGRMKACRGIGAALTPELTDKYDKEHYNALKLIAPDEFTIPHHLVFEVYRAKK